MTGALPTFLIIGAMKCGTTALHRLVGHHPRVAVSAPKELNFFFGAERPPTCADPTDDAEPPADADDRWAAGNHWRGLDWYASHFRADTPVRGEASPGYTSPSHPHVAERVAALLPEVRLVYLVRDPIERAVSQHRHHHRDGAETRPLREALLDPHSQYLARSRYHERLRSFLDRFPRDRILIVSTEDLRARPAATIGRVLRFLGAAPPTLTSEQLPAPAPVARTHLDPALRDRLAVLLRDDADRLRTVAGHRFAGWSV